MTVGNSDVPKRRVSLQTEQTDLQTESQGQQVADKLPASEKIEARHGDQIRAAGYKSVIEFIEEDAKNMK